MKPSLILTGILCLLIFCSGCDNEPGKNDKDPDPVFYTPSEFIMGADLSYVNQILDHGGVYRDSAATEDPYAIFSQYGCNVVRLRLFHNPEWTRELYGTSGTQMYNDFEDVKTAIQMSRKEGMQVCLDFHYSDTWADPAKQAPPSAWKDLTLEKLHDSLYNYTFNILDKLGSSGLMPEYVQVGNEINPGFVLPLGKRWDGNEDNMIYLLNSAIRAVRDAGSGNTVNPKIIIHIAQPENADPWFNGLAARGLADYDIIGLSYYYMWSSTGIADLDNVISGLKSKYGKEVMIMETAYPWTTSDADNYNNIIAINKIISAYPATPEGQLEYMKILTQKVIDGGGRGVFYWEPAWITSEMKDSWGTGSSWDCNTFFDFNGNVIAGMKFMTVRYNGITR
jgi:arabinogalactan endo-1,4-beta-galactosidase